MVIAGKQKAAHGVDARSCYQIMEYDLQMDEAKNKSGGRVESTVDLNLPLVSQGGSESIQRALPLPTAMDNVAAR